MNIETRLDILQNVAPVVQYLPLIGDLLEPTSRTILPYSTNLRTKSGVITSITLDFDLIFRGHSKFPFNVKILSATLIENNCGNRQPSYILDILLRTAPVFRRGPLYVRDPGVLDAHVAYRVILEHTAMVDRSVPDACFQPVSTSEFLKRYRFNSPKIPKYRYLYHPRK